MSRAGTSIYTAAAPSLDDIVAEIVELKRRVADRTPQLTHSAIDDGALVTTSSGQLATVIGLQYDGTSGAFTVASPTPPQPSMPTIDTVIGGVRVRWDGTYPDQPGFTSPVVAPMDFARVEVHVSDSPDFPATGFGTMKASIGSPRGGDAVVPWEPVGTPLYARLVVRTVAGKASLPSLTAGPANSGAIQLADLGFNIAAYSGGNTIYYGSATPTAPTNGFSIGDLWLKQTGTASDGTTPLYATYRWDGSKWVLLQAQGISDALANALAAQQTANSKATQFVQATAPTYSGAANTAFWTDTANGNRLNVWDGSKWTVYQLGNGAIQPQSLIASNVIATGTVTAALLETMLVLASTIVAGNPQGDHARMTSDGFRVLQADPNGGTTPVEVIRMGTSTSDFFGVVDATGKLVASIDDTGAGHFSDMTVSGDPTFGGTALSVLLGQYTRQSPGRFSGFPPANGNYGAYGPIQSRVGVAEVNGYLTAGRDYEISWIFTGMCDVDDRTEARIYLQYEGPTSSGSDTANAPTVNSVEVDHWLKTFWWASRWETGNASGRFSCTTTGRHRFLLTVERGALGINNSANSNIYLRPEHRVSLVIKDIGPTSDQTGQFTQAGAAFAGGSTPSPTPTPPQQYYVELSPSGTATYRGNGSQRSDTSDIVQGYDPSGYNGDGSGWWVFNIPNITGSVDRVDWYVYTNLTYYSSGGTAIWNLIHGGPGYPVNNLKMRGDWYVGGYPKPGPMTVTLPSDWFPFFKSSSSPQAIGISAGPSGGTNETYYCRFDGPSARLRIWYTQ